MFGIIFVYKKIKMYICIVRINKQKINNNK